MWPMSGTSTGKTNAGNFFEDFTVGQVIEHATPRTITEGDRALYQALYPTRFALPSSAEFAAAVGLEPHPVEELIAFHVAFGKTVPDVSLNAVANLGYAECRFHQPVVPGDTPATESRSSASSRTPTAGPASSTSARPRPTSAARWPSTGAAG